MPILSPYRSLPAEKRISLLMSAMSANREARALYTARLLSRGGGFRAVTINAWPAEKLAREIVRMKAEQPQDELDLLHLLYVQLEPMIQIDFLDTAGVAHEKGVMPEDLQPPFVGADKVKLAAAKVLEQHGEDGARYLHTLARYSAAGWPGIVEVAEKLNT